MTCPEFLPAANANGNNTPTPTLGLTELDIVAIGLKVCVAGTNECSPPDASDETHAGASLINIYEGAPLGGPIP